MTNTITKITYDGEDYIVGGGGEGDVIVSDQPNNILQSGMKIRAGEETDYANLGTYDSQTLYLTVPDSTPL